MSVSVYMCRCMSVCACVVGLCMDAFAFTQYTWVITQYLVLWRYGLAGTPVTAKTRLHASTAIDAHSEPYVISQLVPFNTAYRASYTQPVAIGYVSNSREFGRSVTLCTQSHLGAVLDAYRLSTWHVRVGRADIGYKPQGSVRQRVACLCST